jgi:hypothetical protein
MYNLQDLRQAATGAMTGIFGLLLFFVVDSTPVLLIEPIVGLIITILFLILLYFSIKQYIKQDTIHHIIFDYLISLVLALIAGLVFKRVDFVTIFSFNIFASMPIIVSWIISIPAVIFDMKGTHGFIERWTYFGGESNKNIVNPLVSYCNSKYKEKSDIDKCLSK